MIDVIGTYDPSDIAAASGLGGNELLAEVKNAILSILSGAQYYRIGSMEVRRANLSDLYAIKRELEAESDTKEYRGIGRRSAAAFFDRR